MNKNIDSNQSSKLHALKSVYEKIQFSLTYKDSLLEKRETLHHHIDHLKSKMAQEKIDCHLAHRSGLSTVESLEEAIGKHRILLDQSIQELRELDKMIDDLEDYSAEQIVDIQLNVVNDLITLFPDQKGRYQKIDDDLSRLIKTRHEWSYIKDITSQLESLLTALLNERKGIRGFGLLKYVFGMNPNVLITKHLKEIDRLVKNELKNIESISNLDNDEELSNKLKFDLKTIMKELEALSPKRWSFHIIDHGYACYLDKVQEVRGSIDEFSKGLNSYIEQSEAKKRDWIEEMLRHQ